MAQARDAGGEDKPEYWHDPELNRIGDEIRSRHHEHLHDAEITFLMTSKPMTSNSRAVAGKARKASGLLKYYARKDFIIIVSDDFWKLASPEKRRALVDHELCHLGVEINDDGERVFVILPHDIEEFTRVVKRHGLWDDGLERFGQAVAEQLELPIGKIAKTKDAAKPEAIH